MDAAIRNWCRSLGNYSVARTHTEARGTGVMEHFEAGGSLMSFKPPRLLNPNAPVNDRRALTGSGPRLVATIPVTRDSALEAADAAQLPHARKTLLRRQRA
jgi:hypothetical protein